MNRLSEDGDRSRPQSRRNSATLSRRGNSSAKKETERKPSPHHTSKSVTSTPKKTAKPNVDFLVTGKQILKRSDRANSLPGAYHRRPSVDSSANVKSRKPVEFAKRTGSSYSSQSRETSLEDDLSLDLSQVSDCEHVNSKYRIRKPLATSTPQPRSASLQSHLYSKLENQRAMKLHDSSIQSREMSLSYSRESFKTSSTESPHRYPNELDYSSVSPEYSGQSSTDLSPSRASQILSPRSQDLQMSSCCVSSWQDSEDQTKVEDLQRTDGEWSSFWANYNNSLAKVPLKQYYDQCPTPYRSDTLNLADFEFSDGSRKCSPDNMQAINNVICAKGLHLTPNETQNMIKCAHLLGNVLSKAIERHSNVKNEIENPEMLIKKNTMILDLKETNTPAQMPEEKRCETVTTQTDISLPNTKSTPKIFEKILRQLSKNSIDVDKVMNKEENCEVERDHGREKEK